MRRAKLIVQQRKKQHKLNLEILRKKKEARKLKRINDDKTNPDTNSRDSST